MRIRQLLLAAKFPTPPPRQKTTLEALKSGQTLVTCGLPGAAPPVDTPAGRTNPHSAGTSQPFMST